MNSVALSKGGSQDFDNRSGDIQVPKKAYTLLVTARRVITSEGFRKITVEEICRQAGISKMTFYKYARGIEDLVIQVIQMVIDEVHQDYLAIKGSEVSFYEKLKAVLELKLRTMGEYSKQFLEDVFQSVEIRNYFMNQRQTYQDILEFIKEGQEAGVLRHDMTPEFLYTLSDILMSPQAQEKLAQLYSDPHLRNKRMLEFYFYGIIDPEYSNRSASVEQREDRVDEKHHSGGKS